LKKADVEQLINQRLEQRLAGFEVTIQQQAVSLYSGPLPPADETAKYEAVMPGFTDRWVVMAEKEQLATHATTKRRDVLSFLHSLSALLVAGSLCFLLIGGGLWLINGGKSLQGFTSIGSAAALVFWGYRRNAKKQQQPKG
jgi:uncharacterized membrane protein